MPVAPSDPVYMTIIIPHQLHPSPSLIIIAVITRIATVNITKYILIKPRLKLLHKYLMPDPLSYCQRKPSPHLTHNNPSAQNILSVSNQASCGWGVEFRNGLDVLDQTVKVYH